MSWRRGGRLSWYGRRVPGVVRVDWLSVPARVGCVYKGHQNAKRKSHSRSAQLIGFGRESCPLWWSRPGMARRRRYVSDYIDCPGEEQCIGYRYRSSKTGTEAKAQKREGASNAVLLCWRAAAECTTCSTHRAHTQYFFRWRNPCGEESHGRAQPTHSTAAFT